MDDRLQKAIESSLHKDDYRADFERIFKKVFGIKPDVDDVDYPEIVAHGETWAIDPTGTLLYYDDKWNAIADVNEFARLKGMD